MAENRNFPFCESLSAHPGSINLELTNSCDLKCGFCLNCAENFRQKGFMDKFLFHKLIDEIPKDTVITLCGIGEPTLHPNFLEFLNVLSERFNNILLVTNAYSLDRDKIDAILNSGISKVSVSLDYLDKRTYEKAKHGDLDKVVANIDLLLKLKRKQRTDLCVQINMLYEKGKEKQIRDSILYFGSKLSDNDFVYSRHLKSLAGQVNIGPQDLDNWGYLAGFKQELSLSISVEKYRVENWCEFLGIDAPIKQRITCRHPFLYCMILYDGRVSACCVDFNASLILGDLNKNTLKEIWSGHEYGRFRDDMKNLDFSKHELCRNCDEWFKQK